MDIPRLTPQQQAQLATRVATYIRSQRQAFFASAASLTPQQLATMNGFFKPDLLRQVQLLTLTGPRIQNPPFFFAQLQVMGFTNLPDFERMAAVTFVDVIVSHQPCSAGLLFHELVHAEQYSQLGIGRFAELYVNGFLLGGGYDGIPLEVNAYALGDRFEANPAERFSVADEVTAWIDSGRF